MTNSAQVVGVEDRLAQVKPGDDAPKAPTAREADDIRKIREACGNTVQLVIHILSDFAFYQMSVMIVTFLGPVRKFHSVQCKSMRSAPEALAWHQAQARGTHMATVNEVMSLLADETVMEKLRLGVIPDGHTIRDLFEAHPVVVEDTKLAGQCGSLALSLVGRRVKSHAWYEAGFPGQFALLVEDGADATRVLRAMKAIWEAFGEAKQQTSAFWKKLCARSILNTCVVKAMFELAEQSEWKWSAAIGKLSRNLFSIVGGTKIDEDANREERMAEAKNMNRKMSDCRRFASLIGSNLAGEVHRYAEVDSSGVYMDRGEETTDIRGLFRPDPKNASVDMRNVMGAQSRPAWPTPSPAHAAQHQADLHLMEHCSAHHRWDEGRCSWISVFCDQTKLLLRSEVLLGSGWFFPLGNVVGVMGLGWPAVEVHMHGKVFYQPKVGIRRAEVRWLPMTSFEDWEAMPFDFIGPLAMALPRSKVPAGIFAKPLSGPDTLLRAMAQHAFSEFPKVCLTSISRHIGLEVCASDSLYTILWNLVSKCCPELSEDRLISILELRVKCPDPLITVVQEHCESDLFDAGERKEIREMSRVTAARKTAAEMFHEEHRARKQRHQASASQPGSKARQRRCPAPPARQYPASLPASEHDWTIEEVKACMPPDAHLYRDSVNCRWQICFGGKSRESRSAAWLKHGHNGAALRMLQEAWANFERIGGAQCPIPGLLRP